MKRRKKQQSLLKDINLSTSAEPQLNRGLVPLDKNTSTYKDDLREQILRFKSLKIDIYVEKSR